MTTLEIIIRSLIGIALLITLVRFKQIKRGSQRYFILYLVGIILLETFAELCFKQWGNNVIVYNIVDVFMAYFFIYWLSKILINLRWVYILSLILTLNLILSLIFENWIEDFNVLFLFTATLVMIVLVFRFYIEFLKSDELIEFKTNPQFWATTGILIFYLGYLPIQVYISKIDGSLTQMMYTTIGYLNIPLYGFIIVALVCPQNR